MASAAPRRIDLGERTATDFRMPGVPTGDQITDKALVCPLLMQQISRLERLDLGYRLHL